MKKEVDKHRKAKSILAISSYANPNSNLFIPVLLLSRVYFNSISSCIWGEAALNPHD